MSNNSKMDQIKGLIFGEEMSSYEARLGSLKTEIEEVFSKLTESQENQNTQLGQLKDQLLKVIEDNQELMASKLESHDKKINERLERLESSLNEKTSHLEAMSLSKSDFSDSLLEMSLKFKQD